ncbi:MAG: hypothetical protein R8G66_11020 [Cytophagales bacterium]|nr:hypothetical protein [Cytophagales bacterium]
MDYALLAKDFKEQGYLHIPAFFDDELMTRINRTCLAHFGMNPD